MNASDEIDRLIAETDDWRGERLAEVRKAVMAATPEMVEEWKWMGTPTWYCDGLVAVASPFKGKVKVTFAQGAKFPDPDGLFNGKDNGNTRRSIDIFEGDAFDGEVLTALVRRAIEYNRAHLKKNAKKQG